MLKVMRRSGMFVPFRILNRQKLLIITYHRFSEAEDGRSTSAHSFDEQLEYLNANYTLLPLSRVAEVYSNGDRMPFRAAVITIDDGFRDSYEIAFPILQKHRTPATLFVVTDFVDQKAWLWTDKVRYLTAKAGSGAKTIQFFGHELKINLDGPASRLEAATRINSSLKTLREDEKEAAITKIAANLSVEVPELPPSEYRSISWDQAREMDSNSVEIGSHTVTHPILPKVSDEQLETELRSSKARIEAALDRPAKLFCYPNGSYDQRVVKAVANAGYECAVTTEPGLNDSGSNALALRRVPAELDLDHFVQSTSGFESVKNRLLAGGKPIEATGAGL